MRFVFLLFLFALQALPAGAETGSPDDAAAFAVARASKLGYKETSGTRLSEKRKIFMRCRHGSVKRNGACVPCASLIPDCASCSSEGLCAACRKGYKIKDGKCERVDCSADADCKDDQSCQNGACAALICSDGKTAVGHVCPESPAEKKDGI